MTMNKKNQHDKLITLCGIQNPSPLMSSGPNLVMLFRTYSQSKGFVANYSFVTNYGITSGEQVDDECYFIYDSKTQIKGTITSPNPEGTNIDYRRLYTLWY